jgi:hypothetical protein
MITLSCDIEGCKNSEPMPGNGMVPTGWAIVQWTTEVPGERATDKEWLISLYKGLSKTIPDDMKRHVTNPTLRILESEEIPNMLVPMSARVCPKCLSEGLNFGHVERGF